MSILFTLNSIIESMLELASILLPSTSPEGEVVIELIICTLVTFALKTRFYTKYAALDRDFIKEELKYRKV